MTLRDTINQQQAELAHLAATVRRLDTQNHEMAAVVESVREAARVLAAELAAIRKRAIGQAVKRG